MRPTFARARRAVEDESVAVTPRADKWAIASFVLGLVSVFGMLVFVTFPAAIPGLVLGIMSVRSAKRRYAIAGIVLSLVGLIVGAAYGYMIWDLLRHVSLQRILQDIGSGSG
jgi:hypothetical protein